LKFFDGANKWVITKKEHIRLLYDFNGEYILIDRLGFDRGENDGEAK
jgi:hypothetical protein